MSVALILRASSPPMLEVSRSRIRKPRLACFSLGSSKSWLRHPFFEAYRKHVLKLLMRHLIVVLGLKFHINRCSLARAAGPFSFASLQKERPGYLGGVYSTLELNPPSAFYIAIWKSWKTSRAGVIRALFDLKSTAVKWCALDLVTAHTDRRTDTEFPGLRSKNCTTVPIRPAKYVTCLIPTRFSTRCRPRQIARMQVSPGATHKRVRKVSRRRSPARS